MMDFWISLKEMQSKQELDYVAPNGTMVYRAEHNGQKGNWFAFSKDDALGYMKHGSKLIKKNIGGLKFINIKKIEEGGEYFEEIVKKYPFLFKKNNNGLWVEHTVDVGMSKYLGTIKSFLAKKGYGGVFTNKRLSLDFEVFVF